MNEERLKKLAEFLDTLPEEKFDFKDYWTDEDGESIYHSNTLCPAVGCSLGWAITLFPPKLDGFFSWRDYGETIFSLTEEDYNHLFLTPSDSPLEFPDFENTPKWAAKHIRRFIERGGLRTNSTKPPFSGDN